MEEIIVILKNIESLFIPVIVFLFLILGILVIGLFDDDDNVNKLRKELESKKLEYVELKVQYECLKYLFTKIEKTTKK